MSRLSFAATVLGTILQLAGLALDAAPHGRDATLAAREGIFTTSNPGHLLFFGGLALTVLGVSAMLLASLLPDAGSVAPDVERSRRVGVASMAAALLVVAALTLAVGVFAPSDVVSTDHVHGAHAPRFDLRTDETHHAEEVHISWERLREIDNMLAEAKAATEEYRDVGRARADGYRQVMDALSGTGAHFVNQRYLDEGGFDVARPEALLYDRAEDGSLELVGVAYMLPRRSDDEKPSTYFGPLARWHEHDFHRPCLTTRSWGHPVTIDSSEADCRAAGYVYIPPEFWMLHVWLFRPSPEGVFSHDNSTIEGPPDISVEGKVK